MNARIPILAALALCLSGPAGAQAGGWSPSPWLEDLAQIRAALDTGYANRDWLVGEREVDLDALFARVANRLRAAGSDAAARAVFDGLVRRIGDGHVDLHWPQPSGAPATTAPATAPPADTCATLGYDAAYATPGIGPRLTGYRPVGAPDDPFPAGLVSVAGRSVGVLRIAAFDPHISPALCREALKAQGRAPDAACDETCANELLDKVYRRFTAALEAQARALAAAGAQTLVVDLLSNGGGSEWAEAAARSLTAKPLHAAPIGQLRSAQWAGQWHALAADLRAAAQKAPAGERAALRDWAAQAEAAEQAALTPCAPGTGCALLTRIGSATGLVGQAPAGAFDGKPWGPLVFSIAQFPYHDGVWSGPLVVLVDDETWSAAEEFAALLQDNGAAAVLGSRTGGAGCGHAAGTPPIQLRNSGARLSLPDCARFRADGSNEVSGVVPDVLIALRARDGGAFRARMIEAALPAAIDLAAKRAGR